MSAVGLSPDYFRQTFTLITPRIGKGLAGRVRLGMRFYFKLRLECSYQHMNSLMSECAYIIQRNLLSLFSRQVCSEPNCNCMEPNKKNKQTFYAERGNGVIKSEIQYRLKEYPIQVSWEYGKQVVEERERKLLPDPLSPKDPSAAILVRQIFRNYLQNRHGSLCVTFYKPSKSSNFIQRVGHRPITMFCVGYVFFKSHKQFNCLFNFQSESEPTRCHVSLLFLSVYLIRPREFGYLIKQ